MNTLTTLYLAVMRFIEDGNDQPLKAAIEKQHPADIASCIGDLAAEEVLRVLRTLPDGKKGSVFGYLDADMQEDIAARLNRRELAQLMSSMSHDERADLFNQLSETQREALLPAMAHAEREDIRRLASYPEGTAGALMTSDYAVLSPHLTAQQAIDTLRREAPDRETIYKAYVIDDQRRLLGVVSLRDLIVARPETPVEKLMRQEVIFAHVGDSQEDVARKIADYDLLALPVINGGDALVGIVTVDDAFDVMDEDNAKRLASFGGTTAISGDDIDLHDSSFRQIFIARYFWLAFLTLFGTVTSTYVASQGALLSQSIVLAAFITPIIAMGGNTGSQSATLVLRAMALGQVELGWRDVWSCFRRELPVAVALGLGIAVLESVLSYYSKGIGWDIITIVSLSIFACTMLGSLLGLTLPFLARLLRQDPATLSAPVISSMMDLLGVAIYFAIAYAVLGGGG